MYYPPEIFTSAWPPLIDAIIAVVLASLLVVGRGSPRRALLLIATGAVVGVALSAVLFAVTRVPGSSDTVSGAKLNVGHFALDAAIVLTYVAWGQLLVATLQADRRGWFVAVVVALALALAVPGALTTSQSPFGHLIGNLYLANFAAYEVVLVLVTQVGALAVLAFALLAPIPSSPASGGAAPPTSA
jgi:hypothetical protein